MKIKELRKLAAGVIDRLEKDTLFAELFDNQNMVNRKQLGSIPKSLGLVKFICDHPAGFITMTWASVGIGFCYAFNPPDSLAFVITIGIGIGCILFMWPIFSKLENLLENYNDVVQNAQKIEEDLVWFKRFAMAHDKAKINSKQELVGFLEELAFLKVCQEHSSLENRYGGGLYCEVRNLGNTLERYDLFDGNLGPLFDQAETRWLKEVNSGELKYATDFQI